MDFTGACYQTFLGQMKSQSLINFVCCPTVNGQKDHNKVKERGQYETVWHPQIQQQPVSHFIKNSCLCLSLCMLIYYSIGDKMAIVFSQFSYVQYLKNLSFKNIFVYHEL